MPIPYFIRKAVVQIDLDHKLQWQEDAACRSEPHTLFEIAATDDPIAEGIAPDGGDPEEQVSNLNLDNFARAKEICNTCPVWHLCYQTADPEDFKWTVRAGITPTGFTPYISTSATPREGGGRFAVTVNPDGVSVCRRCNNPLTGKRRDGRRFCKPCKTARDNETARNRRAVRAAERKAAGISNYRQAVVTSRGKTCRLGHDEWTSRPGNVSKYECYPCRRHRTMVK